MKFEVTFNHGLIEIQLLDHYGDLVHSEISSRLVDAKDNLLRTIEEKLNKAIEDQLYEYYSIKEDNNGK